MLPAVPNSWIVLKANAVAGDVMKLVISVCRLSAALFAASAQSNEVNAPPALTVVKATDGNPLGPLAVVAVSHAASILRFKSRTMDCPTTDSAARTAIVHKLVGHHGQSGQFAWDARQLVSDDVRDIYLRTLLESSSRLRPESHEAPEAGDSLIWMTCDACAAIDSSKSG